MLDFFDNIIAYFEAYNIPYMLSGSIAMGLYVLPRATRDIDFVVQLQLADVDGLIDHFSDEYYCSKDAVIDAVNRKGLFNIIDSTSGYKADFVMKKNESYRLTEFERRKKMKFFGRDIWVVSPEDLLISKLIWIQEWQAAVQMEDIKNLFLHRDLDLDYINYWIAGLKLNTFNLQT